MNDEELSRILRSWQPVVPEPGDFGRNVWRRIQLSEAPQPLLPQSWYEGVFIVLGQPRIAVPIALVAAFIGVILGIGAAHSQNAAGYLRSVNPYAQFAGIR